MRAPGAALRVQVLEQRLEAVERIGEAGVGCPVLLELLPAGPQLLRKVVRQQREEAVRGAPLTLLLVQAACPAIAAVS